MTKESKDKLKGTLIVSVGLTIVFVPFSLIIGWNLITVILFWLVITPLLTIYLPRLVSNAKVHWIESLIGLTIFYAVVIFMIYDHYKTDYFKVLVFSCLVNLIVVWVVARKTSLRVVQ